ncbi:MAG: adenine phosphoribosyltransferase [Planctomycetes bacterium]|nr:adenine phosphoribosyltransferase [Planctomycetota bacterium]MCB9911927.1 adenine phosphoribosyltransferase [Planctomycetota bacterium]HRV81322.1 adenine phosphoribosyltransferase [Planctomycetota bacterium]
MEDPLLERYIRDIPDFPKPGILFKDITPMLQDPEALRVAVEGLAQATDPDSFDLVFGMESRGFIFGTAVAHYLGKGFVPVRKPGKLPYKTVSQSYELEYGSDTLEAHIDACQPGQGVLLIDDLLATGGTMGASVDLVRKLGGNPIACAVVVELTFLNGRDRLHGIPVHSLVRY